MSERRLKYRAAP